MKNLWKRCFFVALCTFSLFSCEPLLEELPSPSHDTVSQEKILRLVNEWRSKGCKCGNQVMPPVLPVIWNEALAKSAYKHSEDMAKNNYFSHTGKNGSTVGDRIRAEGYDWRICAENIAKGYPTEEAVVEGWIKSEGHCRNIMNPSIKEMGVGRYQNYWTQVFASK